MYVRRKVFSNVEQPVEEQLYSVTMTEEQYNLFSEFLEERGYASKEDKKDMAKGAAAGAGTVAAVAATPAAAVYGADKLEKSLKKSRVIKNRAAMKEADSVVSSLKNELAQGYKNEALNKKFQESLTAAKENAGNVRKNLKDAGKIEKGAAAIAKGGAAATKWVKNNPKLAAGIAAGTLVGGASIGANASALNKKKK